MSRYTTRTLIGQNGAAEAAPAGPLESVASLVRRVDTLYRQVTPIVEAFKTYVDVRERVSAPLGQRLLTRLAPRIGQLPSDRTPIPTGSPFVCTHPYQCDLYNLLPDGSYGLVGRARAGSVVTAAPPSWYVPDQGRLVLTNRMGRQILVRAETPYGPREGWSLTDYLRAYAAPEVLPPRRDPRTPVSERLFERMSSTRYPTEVIR